MKIRLAEIEEVDALNKLIKLSASTLCMHDYSKEVLENATQSIFGVDTELLEDKTYYVIEEDNKFVACGGWSKRKTLLGGNQFKLRESGYLDPEKEAAKIRAFFVHPDYARRGLGKKLLNHCEEQAVASGFSTLEMMATLTGRKLYEAQGYLPKEEVNYELHTGISMTFIRMTKNMPMPSLAPDCTPPSYSMGI